MANNLKELTKVYVSNWPQYEKKLISARHIFVYNMNEKLKRFKWDFILIKSLTYPILIILVSQLGSLYMKI